MRKIFKDPEFGPYFREACRRRCFADGTGGIDQIDRGNSAGRRDHRLAEENVRAGAAACEVEGFQTFKPFKPFQTLMNSFAFKI